MDDFSLSIPIDLAGKQLTLRADYRAREGGTSLLLLHGLQSSRKLFRPMFHDPRFDRFGLLAIDLPGFAESHAPDAFSYDLSDHAAAVTAGLRAMSLGSVIAVGHSLGGMIATLLSGCEPKLIRAVVSLEGNLVARDCGESAKIATLPEQDFIPERRALYRTAKSIVEWSASERLLGVFTDGMCPRLLLRGEKSGFFSRPRGLSCDIQNAGHFLLTENPAATYERVVEFVSDYEHPAEADRFRATPIEVAERKPSRLAVDLLKEDDSVVELVEQDGLRLDNRYYRAGIRGTTAEVFLRAAVFRRVLSAKRLLPPEYGFVVFDGYRSKETQGGLFDAFFEQIRDNHPTLSEAELHAETRKFVAHPEEPGRFEVPPHNSGGAVDLGLTYRGSLVDMGTDFDDLTELAATAFFEQPFSARFGILEERWKSIRGNRRLLTHALRWAGFTNWPHEWWHFDLGNCVWSPAVGVPWIYGSMAEHVAGPYRRR